VDLHNRFSADHGVMVHIGVKKSKAAGGERFHFVGVELIAHPEFEGPRNDGDIFAFQVKMGRDTEPIRHLQANREVAGLGMRTTATIKLLAFLLCQSAAKLRSNGWSEVSAAVSHAGPSS
jgi:hypothetical protein